MVTTLIDAPRAEADGLSTSLEPILTVMWSISSAIMYFRSEFEDAMHTPAWELFPYERSTIFVRDPAVIRSACAIADGTSILSVGGPVGVPYEVSRWEASFS